MAITVFNSPGVVSSVKSDIVFDVVSDSTDTTTKVVAILFYRLRQDSFYRIASRKEQSKRNGYNYFRFNFSANLDTVLNNTYQTGSTALKTNTECSCQYFVKFIEYYPSSAYVAHDELDTGSFYACNTVVLPTETQGVYTGSSWYMDGVASHKFLTNSLSNQTIRSEERIQLGFLTSYTDPVVKVQEVKYNATSATTTYSIGNQTYNTYLWDWTVDESNVVTIETEELYTQTDYFEAVPTATADAPFKYMPDNSYKMWGGVKLIELNEQADIILPVLTAASADIFLRMKAITSACDYVIYYFYSGTWNISALGTQTAPTGSFVSFTETLPTGTTKVRIKKLEANTNHLYIAYGYVSYVDNNAQNKRCQFTLDTTHVDSDTNYFNIWVEDGSSNIISEVKRFTVDRRTVGDTSRFAFANLRGDFDHYTFTQGHAEALLVDKIRTENELPIGFTSADRQTNVTFVNSDIVFTSWTRYETNEALTWLKELVESKEVYLIVDDTRYSVDILTSEVEYSHHSDALQFEISWRFAIRRNV